MFVWGFESFSCPNASQGLESSSTELKSVRRSRFSTEVEMPDPRSTSTQGPPTLAPGACRLTARVAPGDAPDAHAEARFRVTATGDWRELEVEQLEVCDKRLTSRAGARRVLAV
jgi:hypothetical protein